MRLLNTVPDHIRPVLEPLLADAELKGYARGVAEGKAAGQSELLSGLKALQYLMPGSPANMPGCHPVNLSQPVPAGAEQVTDDDDVRSLVPEQSGDSDAAAFKMLVMTAVQEAMTARGEDPRPVLDYLGDLLDDPAELRKWMRGKGDATELAWKPAKSKSGGSKAEWDGEGGVQRKPLYGKQADAALGRQNSFGGDVDDDEVGKAQGELGATDDARSLAKGRKAAQVHAKLMGTAKFDASHVADLQAVLPTLGHKQLGDLRKKLMAQFGEKGVGRSRGDRLDKIGSSIAKLTGAAQQAVQDGVAVDPSQPAGGEQPSPPDTSPEPADPKVAADVAKYHKAMMGMVIDSPDPAVQQRQAARGAKKLREDPTYLKGHFEKLGLDRGRMADELDKVAKPAAQPEPEPTPAPPAPQAEPQPAESEPEAAPVEQVPEEPAVADQPPQGQSAAPEPVAEPAPEPVAEQEQTATDAPPWTKPQVGPKTVGGTSRAGVANPMATADDLSASLAHARKTGDWQHVQDMAAPHKEGGRPGGYLKKDTILDVIGNEFGEQAKADAKKLGTAPKMAAHLMKLGKATPAAKADTPAPPVPPPADSAPAEEPPTPEATAPTPEPETEPEQTYTAGQLFDDGETDQKVAGLERAAIRSGLVPAGETLPVGTPEERRNKLYDLLDKHYEDNGELSPDLPKSLHDLHESMYQQREQRKQYDEDADDYKDEIAGHESDLADAEQELTEVQGSSPEKVASRTKWRDDAQSRLAESKRKHDEVRASAGLPPAHSDEPDAPFDPLKNEHILRTTRDAHAKRKGLEAMGRHIERNGTGLPAARADARKKGEEEAGAEWDSVAEATYAAGVQTQHKPDWAKTGVEWAGHPDGPGPRTPLHREKVASALAAGKPVPAEVLAEYPDLQQSAPKPSGSIEQNTPTAPEPVAPAEPPVAEPAPAPASHDEVFSQLQALTKKMDEMKGTEPEYDDLFDQRSALEDQLKASRKKSKVVTQQPIPPVSEGREELDEDTRQRGAKTTTADKERKAEREQSLAKGQKRRDFVAHMNGLLGPKYESALSSNSDSPADELQLSDDEVRLAAEKTGMTEDDVRRHVADTTKQLVAERRRAEKKSSPLTPNVSTTSDDDRPAEPMISAEEGKQAEMEQRAKVDQSKFSPNEGAFGTNKPFPDRVQANDGKWYLRDEVTATGPADTDAANPPKKDEGMRYGDDNAEVSAQSSLQDLVDGGGDVDASDFAAISAASGVPVARVKKMHEDLVASTIEDHVRDAMAGGKLSPEAKAKIAEKLKVSGAKVANALKRVGEQDAFIALQDMKAAGEVTVDGLKKVAKDTGLTPEQVRKVLQSLDDSSQLGVPNDDAPSAPKKPAAKKPAAKKVNAPAPAPVTPPTEPGPTPKKAKAAPKAAKTTPPVAPPAPPKKAAPKAAPKPKAAKPVTKPAVAEPEQKTPNQDEFPSVPDTAIKTGDRDNNYNFDDPGFKAAGYGMIADPKFRQTFMESYDDMKLLKEFRDGVVEIPRMYRDMAERVPGLTVPQFHAALMAIAKNKHVELHVLNEVSDAWKPEQAMLKNGRMLYYVRTRPEVKSADDLAPTPA